YLVAAVLLLVAGAYLTSGGEPPKTVQFKQVKMPRRADDEDRARAVSRVGAQPAHPEPPPPPPGAPPPRPADPMLAALPPDVKEVAVVVEANALRNSDLGEALIACFTAGAPEALGRVRDAGFDPLTQLDRVSMFDDTLMLTGDFTGITGLGGGERYGEAQLTTTSSRDGSERTYGFWRGQAALIGTREEVKQAIDRLEGRVAAGEQPVLKSSDAYGELYGVLKPAAFADALGDTEPQLAELIRSAAKSVDLHVDAMHDVGMVADVKGMDAQRVDELRRMMGGAIAAARARAMAKGEKEAADVLDLSRVLAPEKGGDSFKLELGLPYEMVKAQLDKCAREAPKRREARRAAASDGGG
ncbi:MAG: hypothetical protein JNK82_34380, partial [Myxococcaceae bacterium]|nr:hypothetical protein [Myxococcaceae bacterium]